MIVVDYIRRSDADGKTETESLYEQSNKELGIGVSAEWLYRK